MLIYLMFAHPWITLEFACLGMIFLVLFIEGVEAVIRRIQGR